MSCRRLLFLAVLCLMAIGPVAAARADSEPNNALVQAEGPISGSTDVKGTIGTPDDVDWYVFYVQGQQQLHMTYSSTDDGGGDPCARVYLTDTDGGSISPDFTTPPGTNRYFAYAEDDDEGCSAPHYTFRLEPGNAVVSGPSIQAPTPTGEPNESGEQPAGPLQGGTPYSGSLDTSNDEDWLYFYTAAGQHPVDLAVTGPALDNCDSLEVHLIRDNGEEIASLDPTNNMISHFSFTSPDAARYRIRVEHSDSSCIPEHWQLEVDPADAVSLSAPGGQVVNPPPNPSGGGGGGSGGPSHACRVARGRVNRDLSAQRTLKRQLRHAHSRKRRASLRRRLRVVRRDLHRAVGQRRLHCNG